MTTTALPYTTTGHASAPPVILIHGWLSGRAVWRQTVPALAPHFNCIAVDLLGFGDAPKPNNADYSIAAQAQRVLDLADQLGHERFALIGHSMGGQIATYIAAQLAPERVTKLVSVAGVVTGRLSSFVENFTVNNIALAARFPIMYRIARPWINARWYARLIFKSSYYDFDSVPFDDWAVDRALAFDPAGVHAALHSAHAMRACDLTPHLAAVRAPALKLFGRQDAVVLPEQGTLFAAHVPHSRLVWFDRCGHFPMYEHTAQYLAALTDFLR